MVEFFFVISGFTFYYNYAGKVEIYANNLADFMYQRIARLYPVFLASLVATAILTVLSRFAGMDISFGAHAVVNFLLNLACIHYVGLTPPVHSFNVPAWFISDLLNIT